MFFVFLTAYNYDRISVNDPLIRACSLIMSNTVACFKKYVVRLVGGKHFTLAFCIGQTLGLTEVEIGSSKQR